MRMGMYDSDRTAMSEGDCIIPQPGPPNTPLTLNCLLNTKSQSFSVGVQCSSWPA